MSSYAIAVGGSGARCLESLVHLCAIGLGPEELFVLIIDPDTAHGNTERLRNLITKYQTCREQLTLPKGYRIFNTEIKYSHDEIKEYLAWSPVKSENNLRQYFKYNLLSTELKHVCDLLYSKSELDLDWDQGFKGRASVGAPVMGRIGAELNERPWHDIITDVKEVISKPRDAKVFVFASIFGGTGASGFPTIGKILREKSMDEQWPGKEHLFLGGALLLPYFSFRIPPEKEKEIYARPQHFIVNTQAALKYYSAIWKKSFNYDAIYLVGDKRLDAEGRKFALGGREQANYIHYIELLACLAAFDFFKKEFAERRNRTNLQQYYLGRKEADLIRWEDLPLKEELKRDFLFFSTFAYAYLTFYHPLIRNKEFERRRHLSPWYAEHFLKNELVTDQAKEHQNALKDYLQLYLRWLYEIHQSTTMDLNLLNPSALEVIFKELNEKELTINFNDFTDDHFRTLLFKGTDQSSKYEPECDYGYDELWNELCDTEPAQVTTPTGKLTYLLYEASKKFCFLNYKLKQEKGGE
jgi:hypothetical protein